MSPGHFSHHGSLCVKADDLVEYLSNCTELSCMPRCSFFRATRQVTSQTAVICALWTPAIRWSLIQLLTATRACVRKMKVDIHAVESLNNEAKVYCPDSSTPVSPENQ